MPTPKIPDAPDIWPRSTSNDMSAACCTMTFASIVASPVAESAKITMTPAVSHVLHSVIDSIYVR